MKSLFHRGAVLMTAGLLSLGAAKAANPTDIAPGHWATDDVKDLVDKGYMSLYGDSSFKGDAPLTRYAFVSAMSKLLDQLEAIKAKGGGAAGGTETTEIKALLGQVKSALAQLETAQKAIGEKGEKTGATQEILERDVTKLMDTTNQKLKSMENTISDLGDEMRDRDKRMQAELMAMNEKLRQAQKKNSQARTMLWIGVVAAAAIGASAGD